MRGLGTRGGLIAVIVTGIVAVGVLAVLGALKALAAVNDACAWLVRQITGRES
jgi:hypothetical protein